MRAAEEKFPQGTRIGNYIIGKPLVVPSNKSFVYEAQSATQSGRFIFKYLRPQHGPELIRNEIMANQDLAGLRYLATGFDFVDLDAGETTGYFMNMYSRGDLFDFLVRGSALPEQAAAEMAYRVLRSLHEMHSRGWVHRNVKPENILLTGDGEIPEAYLSDFGFAKQLDDEGFLSGAVGSLPYVAPELLENRPYNEKVDMWAFGVTLFAMLTQQMPFPPPHDDRERFVHAVLHQHWDSKVLEERGMSNEARDLLEHLLCADPTQRLSAREAMVHPFFREWSLGNPDIRRIML